MTKAEIVAEISRSTGVDKENALAVVEKFMEVVKDSLINGENVYLRGFGTFLIKTRAEKVARHIANGTAMVVPAHNIPSFKPAKSFKDEVAK